MEYCSRDAMILAVLICLSAVATVKGYSRGAGMQACLTMMPLHGPSPERGSGGFEVTATQDTFAPGDIVPVTISGIRPFKGFLLQARTPRDDTIVGTFEPPPEGVRYLAECGDRNSVTHSNPNLKSSVTVFWRAPRSGLLRSIRFYVTVVESFSQIYRKLTSEIVISELDVVQAEYGPWGPWSTCSASCGPGIEQRTRVCPGNAVCAGTPNEIRSCNLVNCGELNYGPWSVWGPCTATCGYGMQDRIRECNSPFGCAGLATETRQCTLLDCPTVVTVNWNPWSSFSPCSATCGTGTRYRSRNCPLDGACIGGEARETIPCDAGACPVNWNQWSPFSGCSATCGSGVIFRSRTCPIDGACIGGAAREERTCDAGPCPVFWGEWGPFTACSSSCGAGVQTRKRTCPIEGSCVGGAAEEEQKCDAGECPDVYSPWTPWGDCSRSCGQGMQERSRFCTGRCFEPTKETRECVLAICEVPVWTQWSTYSPCSATCDNGGGQGVQERTRICPSNDPTQCPGVGKETRDCFIACDTASWANWLEWGQCSVTCGQGVQERQRFCARAFPTLTCPGEDKETRTCSAGLCPSQYTQWGVWGQCSVSCGDGVQRRNRICLGGACADPTTETRPCSIICEAPKPVVPVVPVAPMNPKPNGQTNVVPSEPVKQPVIGTPDCYDCNSGWGVCAPTGITQPGWVGKTPCPKTKTCFIRRDKGGYVYRGCADAWPALASIATSQADGLSCISGKQLRYSSYVDVWCFCQGDRCNGGGM